MKRLVFSSAVLGLCLSVFGQPAQGGWDQTATMPAYQPKEQIKGNLRLWGHGSPTTDFMGRLVKAWEADFARFQPGVTFEYKMYGTASAIGALYTGAGDLALMGEEVFPFEMDDYIRATGRRPAQLEIATGSVDVRNFDFAQMIYVHASNPLAHLTLAQIDAIFGTEHLKSPANIRTWGQLGLTGEWANRPIHVYGWSYDNDFWFFLRDTVFGGSHRQRGDLQGYAHIHNKDGTIYDAGQQELDTMANDPAAIGISNSKYARPGVKALALGSSDAGPFIDATKENMVSRAYPLTRIIPAVYNQVPGQPMEPALREFLTYILSRDGQAVVVKDAEYLPLSAVAVGKARQLLAAEPPKPVRITGNDRMRSVIESWEAGYQKTHPEVTFENQLHGTGTGLAGLYTQTSEIAFLGRPVLPVESMGFAWVFGHRPYGLEVATGSLNLEGNSPALAVYVSPNNPIKSISFEQLDAVFGAQRRRGGAAVTTWGDLGVTGEWASHPLAATSYDTGSNTMGFFRDVVLMGSFNWNYPLLHDAAGDLAQGNHEMAKALSENPDMIAIASAGALSSVGRMVPVESPDLGKALLPTEESLTNRHYPLRRSIYAYVNRVPKTPLDPRVLSFLQYVLGDAGQADIARDASFLPLDADTRAQEAQQLK